MPYKVSCVFTPTLLRCQLVAIVRATVKVGTQERGTERGMEVIWFHTGNYTERCRKFDTKSHSDDATVAFQQLLSVAAQLSSLGSAAYH